MTVRDGVSTEPRIVTTRGARACEQALLQDLDRCLDAPGAAPGEGPIHLVVPSHSLRSHLLDRIVRHRGRSVAGLTCWTLHGLALELLERCGVAPAPGGDLLPLFARRLARREKPLRDALDHLRDGYAAVVGSVRDLLEAGLEPAHREALEELLASEGAGIGRQERERARSVVRVAVGVAAEMERLGLGHASTLLRQATELLRTRPEIPLAARALLIHGFADAIGLATDLIEALLERFGGVLYLDRPPDPVDPDREDSGVEFSRRFGERLLARMPPEPREGSAPAAAARIELFRALGPHAEVREVARRVRRLLDQGARPEGIGVVARQQGPYRSAVRTHLWRLGVSFSAVGALGPQLPFGRRVQALLDLVIHGERARVERWLDAREEDFPGVAIFDLRLALFGLGATRIAEVAALPLEELGGRGSYPLPVRHGFGAEEEPEAGPRLRRRQVPFAALHRARDEARAICEVSRHWQGSRTRDDHLANLDGLLEILRWDPARLPVEEVRGAVRRLAEGLPPNLELELDELGLLLSEAVGAIGFDRFGGRGSGVQVLDVIEARGRTFEHLFLLGLNKGVFPRAVREDPVLPDALRQLLGREGYGLLPDLARKRLGHAEERYLFAQLLSSSQQVTVSWQVVDDDRRELAPSPFVERLLWRRSSTAGGLPTHPPIVGSPTALHDPASSETALRTPWEEALRAALWGSRSQLSQTLTVAVRHADSEAASWRTDTPVSPGPPEAAERLAAARVAVIREVDRVPAADSRLGPYFGYVGAARERSDPRLGQTLYLTTLESFAVCPWRTFLERLLRIEGLPDPVEVLPGLDPLLLGRVVHQVLESIVVEQLAVRPSSLEEALGWQPEPVRWPSRRRLERLARAAATSVAQEQGVSWPGFARVLAEVALPYLDQARALVWEPTSQCQPVAAELEARLEVAGAAAPPTLGFRADRVDRTDEGLAVIDYKTSRRGVYDVKTAAAQRRHLLAAIRSGRMLQAVAYAQSPGDSVSRGSYVFIHPDFASGDDHRIVSVEAADSEARETFAGTVGVLVEAWRAGVFFPRLVEPDKDAEPGPCAYCAVAEACLRGDSGARGRLREWTRTRRAAGHVDEVFLRAWWLASDSSPEGGE